MPIVYITRRAEFCASHRLHSDALSADENRRLFGKCNNVHGHGHNYAVEVTLRGEVDPRTGMVMNLVDLKMLMNEKIVNFVDHKHLNLDVPEFRDLVPSTENLAVVFWRLLEPALPKKGLLYEIRVYETAKNMAIYRGE